MITDRHDQYIAVEKAIQAANLGTDADGCALCLLDALNDSFDYGDVVRQLAVEVVDAMHSN